MQLFVFKTIVKGATRGGLVVGVVKLFKEGVLQGLLDRHALVGTDLQHFAHEIESFQGRAWELQRQVDGRLAGKLSHKALGLVGSHKVKVGFRGLAELFGNESQL